jgi:hypothetical protein
MDNNKSYVRVVRIALAFAIAPLVPGLVAAMVGGSALRSWYVEVSIYLGYSVAVLIGLPSYVLFLRRKEYHSAILFIKVGAILGAITYIGVFSIPLILSRDASAGALAFHSMVTGWPYLILAVIFGVIATLSFWAIAFARIR